MWRSCHVVCVCDKCGKLDIYTILYASGYGLLCMYMYMYVVVWVVHTLYVLLLRTYQWIHKVSSVCMHVHVCPSICLVKANTQCFIANHTSPVTTHAQVNTSDFSSNQWMTCFQDTGAEILGCSAQELGEMKEQNSPEYDSVFQKANFKDFMFRVRAKMDTYNVS